MIPLNDSKCVITVRTYTCTYSVYSVGHPLAFHTFVLENPHMGSNISPPSYGQTAYKSLLWETIVCMTQQTNLVDLLLIFLFRNTKTRWWRLKYFSFSPRKSGKMNTWTDCWRACFSKGLLQPPTRNHCFCSHMLKFLSTSQAFAFIFWTWNEVKVADVYLINTRPIVKNRFFGTPSSSMVLLMEEILQQLRLVVYPIIYKVLYRCRISEPSTIP